MVEGHTNWTTMFLQILFLICSVCNTHGVASAASPSCTSDEYRAGQLCCLACPRGYRVHRDCTATTITLCSKCPDGTFKEGLSGQKQCFACTKCVTGLKVKKRCTPTSDAECEIRDGFFCSESADKDTFPEATLSCQSHTICDSGVQIQPGTDSTDSTCIKYVAIVFIIIGCIFFIILIVVLGALVYKWLKMERDLTELEKLIDEMETSDQRRDCYTLRKRLDKKKKTQKQKRKFVALSSRYWEKTAELKVDWKLTNLEKRIDKMETPGQEGVCYKLIDQLKEKQKTTEQKLKFDELIGRHKEKNERLEQDKDLTEWGKLIDEMGRTDHWVECYKSADEICATKKETQELETEFYKLISKLLEETPEQWRELKALICRLHKKNKTKEQQNKFDELFYRLLEETPGVWTELRRRIFKNHTEETPGRWPELEAWIDVLLKETPEQRLECLELDNRIRTMKREKHEQHGGAAGEGTSRYTSTPLLCPELLAGLETSIPPALSTETQPAEETTPLMSSESPAPTGDQQEHTSRTTPDGHDDDQSLGPEDDVIRRDISASQSIPSTSQSSPSTSQSIPSTSQSSPSTSQSIPSSSQSIPSILPSARRSGAGERDIEMGPVPGFLHTDSVSLLKGNDITGDKVTHESESDDSNSETRGGNTPV